MKGLIAYDTKYGSTKEVCDKIAQEFKDNWKTEMDIVNVKEIPEEIKDKLDNYGIIIIASPIYFKKILPSVNEFINKNKEVLQKDTYTVFIAVHIAPLQYVRTIHTNLSISPASWYYIKGVLIDSQLTDDDKRILQTVMPKFTGQAFDSNKIFGEISGEDTKKCVSSIMEAYIRDYDRMMQDGFEGGLFDREAAIDKCLVAKIEIRNLNITYTVIVKNGSCKLEKGVIVKPHVIFLADSHTCRRMAAGKEDASQLYLKGEIIMKGEEKCLYDFLTIFPYFRESLGDIRVFK